MSVRAPLPPELERALTEAGPLLEGEARRRLVSALARFLRDAELEEERVESLRRMSR